MCVDGFSHLMQGLRLEFESQIWKRIKIKIQFSTPRFDRGQTVNREGYSGWIAVLSDQTANPVLGPAMRVPIGLAQLIGLV